MAVVWAEGPNNELELTGEVSGSWRLGRTGGTAVRVTADGVDFCRRLSGRPPDTGVSLEAGDAEVLGPVEALQVLF
ncbi:hypothetical protein [Paenarthrobacter sp. PH39-S1]|uniref:hypothetical protein n=1 Tax=Paenarthrobacter sp. PH39-S1 TaxID=3046204 RepID=UPI0024BBAAFB|nr:hypothetical protein [Paenarthrobacter sp. PH39-S1]MDJ0357881.1 hypothetical protein [Paenarthrobacter sp. PH39-S1]